jgi:hypothetical protein
METEQIKRIIYFAEMFTSSFGAYPDLEEIKKGHYLNLEEIGEPYEEFTAKTLFQAFCEMYFIDEDEITESVYDTFMVMYQSEHEKKNREREYEKEQNEKFVKSMTLTASHK